MSISTFDRDKIFLTGNQPNVVSSQVNSTNGNAPRQAVRPSYYVPRPHEQVQRVMTTQYHSGNRGMPYPSSTSNSVMQPFAGGYPNHLTANRPAAYNLMVPVREPTPEQPMPIVKEEIKEELASTSNPPVVHDDVNIDIQIRNVVCNYTLPLHIDLRKLAQGSSNVHFDRGRGVLMKQRRNPNCYIKVYSSGKVYIVGCRSELDCMRAARSTARHIQRIMDKVQNVVRIRNYKVCNVLATCKMPFGIKIEELAYKYPAQSQYEPELSVGLIWRSTEPKATLRIHTTGSITVTGASSEEDVGRVLEAIYPIVCEFRCPMRLRAPPKKRVVKRHAPAYSLGHAKRPCVPAMGNKVYFSDEDDDAYDEEDLLDD